jgi:hypothetical protein
MSRPKSLLLTLLALSGVSLSFATAPLQIGDMFLVVGEQFHGMGSNNLYYFGSDGSFDLLSSAAYGGNGLPPKYQPSQQGTYTYVVTPGNPNEATVTLSSGGNYVLEFTTGLSGAPNYGTASSFSFFQASENGFLANVSNRVVLRTAETAVTGFVIQGNSSRLVLIRAVGPTLAQFGVTPVTPSPQFNLFSGIGADQIGSGEPWSSASKFDSQAMSWIFGKAGAFQLMPGSKDVAFFGILAPGTYTAQAFDPAVGASGGSTLVEVYILPYSSIPGASSAF